MADIYLAGGCFWGVEKYIGLIRGVQATEVGYANGKTADPSYEQVCSGSTGHAETVKTTYNPNTIPLEFLLRLFMEVIDPTSLNRQGNDRGSQYRTGIYYNDPQDKATCQRIIEEFQPLYDRPIVVEVLPLENYYPAEEYHQKYLEKNPGGYCHIGPARFDKAAKAVVDPSLYAKKSQEDLAQILSPLSFSVTQKNATEPPFDNAYWQEFRSGIYVDITTGEPLFLSTDKFDSGCGWPSFAKPLDPNVLEEKVDASHGMIRTEIRSRLGDAHLGHVFDDGPTEQGGLRYCINSASLRFIPKEAMVDEGYGHLIDLL